MGSEAGYEISMPVKLSRYTSSLFEPISFCGCFLSLRSCFRRTNGTGLASSEWKHGSNPRSKLSNRKDCDVLKTCFPTTVSFSVNGYKCSSGYKVKTTRPEQNTPDNTTNLSSEKSTSTNLSQRRQVSIFKKALTSHYANIQLVKFILGAAIFLGAATALPEPALVDIDALDSIDFPGRALLSCR